MSFRQTLSKMWSNLHYILFPSLEKDYGELSSLHRKLIAILELVRIEEFISCARFNLGRPLKDRAAIARSYIAKIVFKLPHTKQLIKYLNVDKQLRVLCGFDEFRKIPSESKFSRAFKEFANSLLPEKVHRALIKDVYKDKIICHIVIDSAPIEAREKHLKKDDAKSRKRSKDRERRRKKRAGVLNFRENQLNETNLDIMIENLPKQCDKGMKRSAQGYTMF
jgi:hypothetical protein